MRTPIRPGTEMTYQELRDRTRTVLGQSTHTQRALAERLGVAESSISRACTETGPKFQQLQCRILETLTGLRIEKRVRFVALEDCAHSIRARRAELLTDVRHAYLPLSDTHIGTSRRLASPS